jgi:hypothetical protein
VALLGHGVIQQLGFSPSNSAFVSTLRECNWQRDVTNVVPTFQGSMSLDNSMIYNYFVKRLLECL